MCVLRLVIESESNHEYNTDYIETAEKLRSIHDKPPLHSNLRAAVTSKTTMLRMVKNILILEQEGSSGWHLI